MTDKDPKDMTAAELLREADSNPCSMCHLVMTEDESCATTGCASWAYRLADKIDAELAQARELSLLRGAELWAKANGWPDFREGEDFGAWLDRCAFPKPLDEHGEPVNLGERIDDKVRGDIDVSRISYTANGFYFNNSHNSGGSRIAHRITYAHGERVKRPAPEVLGADGLPLDEDDTVYGMGREQHRYTVQVPYSINEEVGTRFCVQCYDHDEGNITWCDPSMLTHERPVLGADGKPIVAGETVWGILSGIEGTVSSLNDDSTAYVEWDDGRWSPCIDCCNLTHTPPDTQERIDEDARKDQFEYWQCLEYECCGCPIEIEGMNPKKRYECNDCCSAMALDLLRRQRELDARKGGVE